MTGQTDRATETTSNNGLGNPIKAGTGLIRSTFRPSDDATIFQFLIPSNMMFARTLETASDIMEQLKTKRADALVQRMRTMAAEIREGITKYGIVSHPLFGAIYAFEVDGYGSHHLMDDANLPSLLSIPLMPYSTTPSSNAAREEVYLNTRLFALSTENGYWMHGDVMSAIGGPHIGPTKAWPLASIVRILTSEDEGEIREELQGLVRSTGGLGMRDPIAQHLRLADMLKVLYMKVSMFTMRMTGRGNGKVYIYGSTFICLERPEGATDTIDRFGWANGMFGQMILDIETRFPSLLLESYQPSPLLVHQTPNRRPSHLAS